MNEPWAILTMLVSVPVAAFVICQVAFAATTVYLHRYLAHGGVELRREVRAVARVVIWMTTALKPRQWARVHRYHHAVVDGPADPHSPVNFGGSRRGAWYVFWRNGPLYTAAMRDERLADKYRDLAADRWDRWFFDHGTLGLGIGIGIACAATATLGHELIGGWIGVAAGVTVGLGASALHAVAYVLGGGAIDRIRSRGRNLPTQRWSCDEHADPRVADPRRGLASRPPRRRELPTVGLRTPT